MRFSRIAFIALLTGTFSAAPAVGQEVPVEVGDNLEDQLPPVRHFFVLEHTEPEAIPDYPDYRSLNLRQEILDRGSGRTVIQIMVDRSLPVPGDPFPTGGFDASFSRYLNPSPHIESDDPEILAIRDQILEEHNPQTQVEAVYAVMRWNRRHLRWGEPTQVPTALEALDRGIANCIGFTHLPAAILRSMGIPARTLRTYIGRPAVNRIIPHYLTEVYYAEAGGWITYEPQGPAIPSPENIVAYPHHDWSREGQAAFRPIATDPDLTVRGRYGEFSEEVDIIPPQLLSVELLHDEIDPNEPEDRFAFRIRAIDEGSGINTIRFYYKGRSTGSMRSSVGERNLIEGNVNDGVFQGEISVRHAPYNYDNHWSFLRFELTDNEGNERIYSEWSLSEMGVPDIATAQWDFRDESMAPQLITISPVFGDQVWTADTLDSPYSMAIQYFVYHSNGFANLYTHRIDEEGSSSPTMQSSHRSNLIRGDYTIVPLAIRSRSFTRTLDPGRYYLDRITLRDRLLNRTDLNRDEIESAFGASYFNVSDGPVPEATGPVGISSVTRIGGQEGSVFSGQADLVINVRGAVKMQEAEFRNGQRRPENAVRVHFNNDGRDFSYGTHRFGNHVFNVRIGLSRAEEVRITGISITDADGEVHEFPYERFRHKMNYITTPD